MKYLVAWFNKHVDMYGRKIVMSYVNDGGAGPTCASFAQQAALQTSRVDKSFATIGDSASFNGVPTYSETAVHNGTIDIGNDYQFTTGPMSILSRFPYAIAPSYDTMAQVNFQQLGWVILKRWGRDRYVEPNGGTVLRKWALVFNDDPTSHALADALLHELQQGEGKGYPGIKNVQEVFLSTTPAIAAAQAPAIAAKFKSEGVNSLVWGLTYPEGPQFYKALEEQNLVPDVYVTNYGTYIALAVLDFINFPSPTDQGMYQNGRLFGVATPEVAGARVDIKPDGSFGSSGLLNYPLAGGGGAVSAYHEMGGQVQAPNVGAPLGGDWAELATLAIGIENAGPHLDALRFSDGVFNATKCQLGKFIGQPQQQSPEIYITKNQPYFYHGYTTYYYVTGKNTYDNYGFFQSQDGYDRFNTFKNFPAKPSYDTGILGKYPNEGTVQKSDGITYLTNCKANLVTASVK